MATPEGRVKAAVKKLLKRYPNLYAHWPVQNGFGAPTLDCNGAIAGRAFAIETKHADKLTPRQLLTKADMERGGYKVFVVGEYVYEHRHPEQMYSGYMELEAWLDQHSSP